jgi:hypothetical protein
VHAHDGTDITRQIATAGGDGKVLDRVQPVGVNHEITVVLVYRRGLASVPVVEELGQRFPLDVVDSVHVKPGAVAWEHNRMGLRDQMFPCSVFDKLLGLDLASAVVLASGVGLARFVLWRVTHLLILASRLRRGSFGRVEGVV